MNASAGSWSSLPTPLSSWVLDVIQVMGHTQMTPVQAATIPLFMQHKDVVVEAVTGSGKTLAFVIPIIERLARREHKLALNQVGALVISPTRELATQIHYIFSLFLNSKEDSDSGSSEFPPPLLLISSDSPATEDVQRFLSTGSDIVIGTPGRIEEFLLGKGRNHVNVKELEVLVLDEADRLLDLGFEKTITRIITHLPKQRRTGLFSATMTDADALSELVRVGLRNPARIVVKVQSKIKKNKSDKIEQNGAVQERRIPANLQNYFLVCRSSEKLVQLCRLITYEALHHQCSKLIVYFATCACVDYFYRILPSILPPEVTLYSLHGHMPPAARTKTLAAFATSIATSSSPTILLATDVAARGLDIPNVDAIIQFDAPADPKAFSHRCGRTARAGKSGRATLLLTEEERDYVDFMSIRKIPLTSRPYILKDGTTCDEVDFPADPSVAEYLSQIRAFVLKDRVLLDKAAKAYVSFVRAYSKHEASYIFRLKNLHLVEVAKSFGLLRLPKMPELKDIPIGDWEDAMIDWDTYSYADEAQERKRLESLSNRADASLVIQKQRAERASKKKANNPWSEKMDRKEERERRREKKDKKKLWMKSQDQKEVLNPNAVKRGRDTEKEDEDDWEELAREERMAKKVRKGEVAQAVFDDEFLS